MCVCVCVCECVLIWWFATITAYKKHLKVHVLCSHPVSAFVSGSVVIFGCKFAHQSLVTVQSVMQQVKLTDDKYRWNLSIEKKSAWTATGGNSRIVRTVVNSLRTWSLSLCVCMLYMCLCVSAWAATHTAWQCSSRGLRSCGPHWPYLQEKKTQNQTVLIQVICFTPHLKKKAHLNEFKYVIEMQSTKFKLNSYHKLDAKLIFSPYVIIKGVNLLTGSTTFFLLDVMILLAYFAFWHTAQ